MTEDIPEIKIALFGARGSGKTTLLSSYYGNLQRDHFEQSHGYHLEAEDTTQGHILLSKYYRLEKGIFPLGTETFSEFTFNLKVHELPEPCAKITWFDYPGGWWENTPKDNEERELRKRSLTKLLSSHVGMLLLDGDRYREEGMAYVLQFLDQFKNEARKIRDDAKKIQASDSTLGILPDQWVIAISKADLLAPEQTAESICKEIVSEAVDQLNGLANIFAARNFGKQYLLISSVLGEGSHVEDAHQYLGLQLIAPITLTSVLNGISENAGTGAIWGPPIYIVETLGKLLKLIDEIDDFLPPKYQMITKTIRTLDLETILKESNEKLRTRQRKAAEKGNKVEAAIAAMQAERTTEAAGRAYYCTQH